MSQHLTIAYVTTRREPHIEWFLESLQNQILPEDRISLVVVDFHYIENSRWIRWKGDLLFSSQVVSPKPCVLQGPSRLTKENWFAASNARNTALCLAPDGWIAYVDDLSVLMPGWLERVREAVCSGYIILGAYRKVKNLVVENGEVRSFDPALNDKGADVGMDSRWNYGSDRESVSANGGMLYGCSVAMPVEALLEINGWPEDLCDGLSSEDYCCGIALQNSGYPFRYDRRMLTLESEEHHHIEPAFRRDDWHFENGLPVRGGNGGDDKSHAALNIAKQSKHFPNSFGEGGIRALRQRILAGEQFPVPTSPDREWFTGQLLSEL